LVNQSTTHRPREAPSRSHSPPSPWCVGVCVCVCVWVQMARDLQEANGRAAAAAAAADSARAEVRFCRYRFSPTGELGYRGASPGAAHRLSRVESCADWFH
jgi:hypothetical protein